MNKVSLPITIDVAEHPVEITITDNDNGVIAKLLITQHDMLIQDKGNHINFNWKLL